MPEYRIIRRAYGEYTEIETVSGWLAAESRAMALEYDRKDGEYFTRGMGESAHIESAHCPVQAAWAYL